MFYILGFLQFKILFIYYNRNTCNIDYYFSFASLYLLPLTICIMRLIKCNFTPFLTAKELVLIEYFFLGHVYVARLFGFCQLLGVTSSIVFILLFTFKSAKDQWAKIAYALSLFSGITLHLFCIEQVCKYVYVL